MNLRPIVESREMEPCYDDYPTLLLVRQETEKCREQELLWRAERSRKQAEEAQAWPDARRQETLCYPYNAVDEVTVVARRRNRLTLTSRGSKR